MNFKKAIVVILNILLIATMMVTYAADGTFTTSDETYNSEKFMTWIDDSVDDTLTINGDMTVTRNLNLGATDIISLNGGNVLGSNYNLYLGAHTLTVQGAANNFTLPLVLNDTSSYLHAHGGNISKVVASAGTICLNTPVTINELDLNGDVSFTQSGDYVPSIKVTAGTHNFTNGTIGTLTVNGGNVTVNENVTNLNVISGTCTIASGTVTNLSVSGTGNCTIAGGNVTNINISGNSAIVNINAPITINKIDANNGTCNISSAAIINALDLSDSELGCTSLINVTGAATIVQFYNNVITNSKITVNNTNAKINETDSITMTNSILDTNAIMALGNVSLSQGSVLKLKAGSIDNLSIPTGNIAEITNTGAIDGDVTVSGGTFTMTSGDAFNLLTQTISSSNSTITNGSITTVDLNAGSFIVKGTPGTTIGTLDQDGGTSNLTNGTVTTAEVTAGTLTANGTKFIKTNGIPVTVNGTGVANITSGTITSSGDYEAVSYSSTGESTLTTCTVNANATNKEIISMSSTTDDGVENLTISGGTYTGKGTILNQVSGTTVFSRATLHSDLNDSVNTNIYGMYITGGNLIVKNGTKLYAHSMQGIYVTGVSTNVTIEGTETLIEAYGEKGIAIDNGNLYFKGGIINIDTKDDTNVDYESIAYGIYVNAADKVNLDGGIINVTANTSNSKAYGVYTKSSETLMSDGNIKAKTTSAADNARVYGVYVEDGKFEIGSDTNLKTPTIDVDAKSGAIIEACGICLLDGIEVTPVVDVKIKNNAIIKVDAGSNIGKAKGVLIPLDAGDNAIVEQEGGVISVNNESGYGVLVQHGKYEMYGGKVSTTCQNGYGILTNYGTVKIYGGEVNTNDSNNSIALYVKESGNIEVLTDAENKYAPEGANLFYAYAKGVGSTAFYVEGGNFAIRGKGSVFFGVKGLRITRDTITDVNGEKPISGGTFISTATGNDKEAITVSSGKISNLLLANHYVRDDGDIVRDTITDDPIPQDLYYAYTNGLGAVENIKVNTLAGRAYTVVDAEDEIRYALEINNDINDYKLPVNISLDSNIKVADKEIWGQGILYDGDINISATGAHKLDLNGYELSYSLTDLDVINVPANGALEIKDESENKTGSIKSNVVNSNTLVSNGTLKFTSGTICTGDLIANGVDIKAGTFTVDGGTVKGGSDGDTSSIYIENGIVTINNGTIGETENVSVGGNNGIKMLAGTLDVNDGTICGNYIKNGIWILGGTANIKGGVIAGDYDATNNTVLSGNAIKIGKTNEDPDTLVVNNPIVNIELNSDTAKIGDIVEYAGTLEIKKGTAINGGIIAGKVTIAGGMATFGEAVIDNQLEVNDGTVTLNGITVNGSDLLNDALLLTKGTIVINNATVLKDTKVSGLATSVKIKNGTFNKFVAQNPSAEIKIHGGTYQNIVNLITDKLVSNVIVYNHYIKDNNGNIVNTKINELEGVEDNTKTYTVHYAIDELRAAMKADAIAPNYTLPCDIYLNEYDDDCETFECTIGPAYGALLIDGGTHILDLNGYCLSNNGNHSEKIEETIKITDGKLTITDDDSGLVVSYNQYDTIRVDGGEIAVDADIKNFSTNKSAFVVNGGTLRINSGDMYLGNGTNGIILNDGNLYVNTNGIIGYDRDKVIANGIKVLGGQADISNCKILYAENGILATAGKLTVNNGTFEATNRAVKISDTCVATLKGGKYSSIENTKSNGKVSDILTSNTTVKDSASTTLPASQLAALKVLNENTSNIVTEADTTDKYVPYYELTARVISGGGGSSSVSKYIVTFEEGDSGTLEGTLKVKIEKGDFIEEVPTVKADDGYKFKGWTIDGKAIINPLNIEIKENTTFTALYEKERQIVREGYVNGDEKGNFNPENAMTRAEVAMIFYRNLKDKEIEREISFEDMDGTEWYAEAVLVLASNGIISGYEDGTFRPMEKISRAEFATIASKYEGIEGGEKTFEDVEEDYWATKYISAAADKGWINGYENGTFKPKQNIKRAEAVKIMNRLLNRIADKDTVDTSLNPFSDVMETYWAFYEILEAAGYGK